MTEQECRQAIIVFIVVKKGVLLSPAILNAECERLKEFQRVSGIDISVEEYKKGLQKHWEVFGGIQSMASRN